MRGKFDKILSLITGIFFGELIFIGTSTLFLFFFFKFETRIWSDVSSLKFLASIVFVYCFLLPVSIFLGAFLSSYIFKPKEVTNFKYVILWTPGVYVSVLALFDLFKGPALFVQILGCLLSFYFPSLWGFRLGMKYSGSRC